MSFLRLFCLLNRSGLLRLGFYLHSFQFILLLRIWPMHENLGGFSYSETPIYSRGCITLELGHSVLHGLCGSGGLLALGVWLCVFSLPNLRWANNGFILVLFLWKQTGSTVLSYVNMVCASLRHSIPKSVVYCQVREAKRSLLDYFFTELGKKEVGNLC